MSHPPEYHSANVDILWPCWTFRSYMAESLIGSSIAHISQSRNEVVLTLDDGRELRIENEQKGERGLWLTLLEGA